MIKKRYLLIIFSTITLISVLYFYFNVPSFKAKAGEKEENFEEINNLWNNNKQIKNITNNKVIIIGDSRMEQIEKEDIDIPTNFTFIAKGGTKINWLENEAIDKLNEKLNYKSNNIKYHIIFNMGVNDLNEDISPINLSNEYYKLYRQLSQTYKDVNFYILSVNPIDMSIINIKNYNQKRTTEKIEDFNSNIIKNINTDKQDNIKYCDSYNSFEFETRDGLHYTKNTDEKIINYLTNKCLDYK